MAFNTERYVREKLANNNPYLQKLKDMSTEKVIDYSAYKGYPCEFARDILDINWWEKQCYVAHLAETHERILVRASHMVGKSYMLAGYCIYNWRTEPILRGTVLSPTLTLTKDVIFSNIRKFMGDDSDMVGTTSPTIYNYKTPDKIIKGLSVSEGVAIQGRHTEGVALIIIDEATGVPPEYWESLESISHGGAGSRWICAYNPIDTSSMVAQLEKSPQWKLVTISALEHPNVTYYDENPDSPIVPIPGAITGPYFNKLVAEWGGKPINKEDAKITDIRLPGTDTIVRPSSIVEARLLGRWPTIGYESIWTDAIFTSIENVRLDNYKNELPEIGVDVARYGNDHSAIAIRQGGKLLELDEYYGYSTTELSNLVGLKAQEISSIVNVDPERIPIKVDVNGVGAGVVDTLFDNGYNVIEIQVSHRAFNPDKYANKRSELWFDLRDKALNGQVSFDGLPTYILNKLRIELLAPKYSFNTRNQIVVESKKETARRTKQSSPNLADAVNLAFYEDAGGITITVRETER